MSAYLPSSDNTECSPEKSLAAVLTLLHCYALRENPDTPNPRLAQAILCQLEKLAEHPTIPAPLQRTCDQLYDAWLPLSRACSQTRRI